MLRFTRGSRSPALQEAPSWAACRRLVLVRVRPQPLQVRQRDEVGGRRVSLLVRRMRRRQEVGAGSHSAVQTWVLSKRIVHFINRKLPTTQRGSVRAILPCHISSWTAIGPSTAAIWAPSSPTLVRTGRPRRTTSSVRKTIVVFEALFNAWL